MPVGTTDKETTDKDGIVAEVREKYGRIAKSGGNCGCGPSTCGVAPEEPASLGIGYRKDEIDALPEGADLGLGCGAPIAHLALRPGETVLDLGSGAGIDAFLAARAVGPGGLVIGVDMTREMIERARANGRRTSAVNVIFRQGRLEALPVSDASIDAVTSNCVINLVPDKARVFAEIARVLRPGGRLVISDVVRDSPLPERIEKDVYAYVGCVAGAALRGDYFEKLREAGLGEAEILQDTDFLARLKDSAPQEAEALLARTGVRWEDVAGKVRSITFRARKAG
jgi:ubiquinone/menaquinone biosynthesis C-methylase UbiE